MIPSVAHTAELQRIASLPRRVWSEQDKEALAAQLTSILKTPAGTMTLRPVQALALHDAGTQGGLLGPIGVGEGKTLATLLLPLVFEAKRPLLLLPGGLIEKTKRDQRELMRHWKIPTHLRIFSYDMLGRVQAAQELHTYQPDAIICDEAHRLKNRRAAVTRRVARYMYDFPLTKFAGLSGTIMDKSIKNFAHLLRWALKLEAPIPSTNEETDEWAQALDENVDPLNRRAAGALLEWCTPEDRKEPAHVAARHAFRRRLVETPGVVATVGEGEHVDCSIYVRGIVHKVAPVTENHFKILRTEWRTPDGWELSQPTDIFRHANELALGFHYVRVDKERYQQWLERLKKNVNSETGKRPEGTDRSILKELLAPNETGVKRTQSRIESASSNGVQPTKSETPQQNENGTARTARALRNAGRFDNTAYPIDNYQSSGQSKVVSALSAKVPSMSIDHLSPSTMTTQPEEFEACSVIPAMRVSDASVTMLAYYREQFPTFLVTARPPTEWLDARSAWARFVRDVLSRSRSLDSELQVANACDDGTLPSETLNEWRAVKDSFSSVTVPVWHDDSALKACVLWMRQPGIVWVEHRFFGTCLSALSGAPYYAEGGLSSDGEYIEDAEPGAPVVASLCNREGKNLQHRWHRNLLVYPSSSAAHWEQMIARTHRPGQQADEVTVDVLIGCRENYDACIKALEGARAIQQMTGKKQKLLLADVTLPAEDEIDQLSSPRWRR